MRSTKEIMNSFQAPDLTELCDEKMKFMQDRFKELMEQLYKDRDALHKKAAIVFALFGAVLSFCVGKILEMQFVGNGFWASFLILESLFLTCCATYLALRCILPSEYAALGAEPDMFLTKSFWSQSLVKMQYAYSLLLQKRITINRDINYRVGSGIRRVSVMAAISPIICAIISGLLMISLLGCTTERRRSEENHRITDEWLTRQESIYK